MRNLRCFWAGQLVREFQISNKDVLGAVADLEDQLKDGLLTHTSCGSIFVLTELCVDVMRDKDLVGIHSMKL